ncbi:MULTISPECIES: hypothetical protein [unclassified Devosia]|uniref:hypothetical protein n=1 Tax=unclassified Devosia TaxID=196773 RepID=UPI001AD1AC16|nr:MULTISPECIES: hypothetical protein [unclassified Devosia]MBN9304824.1 hypothetical protein [Devosia sp.]
MRNTEQLAQEFSDHIKTALRRLADEQPVLDDRHGHLIDRDSFSAFAEAGLAGADRAMLHQVLHDMKSRVFLGMNNVSASAGLDGMTLFGAVWAYALKKANPTYGELSQPCTDPLPFTGIVVTRQGASLNGAAHNPQPLKEILTEYWGIGAGRASSADMTYSEWCSAMQDRKPSQATPHQASLPELTPAFTDHADPLSVVLAAPLSTKEEPSCASSASAPRVLLPPGIR